MPSQGHDKLIRVGEVAEMTGLSCDTIYKSKAGTGTLKRIKLGRSLRFSCLNVLDWIAENTTAAERAAETEPQEPVRLRLVTRPALNRKAVNRILKK